MKHHAITLFGLCLLASACVPSGTILGTADTSPRQRSSNPAPATRQSETVELPPSTDSDLGLLEPKDLRNLPKEQDMTATSGNHESAPVIATPPSE